MTKENEPVDSRDVFFIGYISAVPRALAIFLILITAAMLGGMAGLALAVGTTVNDPGDGRFAGGGRLIGTVRLDPYPVLHVAPFEENAANAVLLSGPGKRGVRERLAEYEGQKVQLRGAMIKRGTIDMLQVGGGRNAIQSMEGEGPAENSPLSAPEPLGRWRLTGEICDGKCYTGAMRPGRGLAHKACANLCVIGGVPPVFVSTAPVEGEVFFLLADAEGNALPEDLYDLMALTIEIEGDVERRDDLMVFKVNLDDAKVL